MCGVLPDNFFYKENIDKFILRDILSKKFSSKIYSRRKQGFEPPLDIWLKGPLKDWAYDIVEKSDDYINSNKLKFFLSIFFKRRKKIDLQIMELNNV